MFNWISRRAKGDRVKDAFGKHLSAAVIEHALKCEPAEMNTLSTDSIDFVFVAVRGVTSNQTAQHLGDVASVAHHHNWMVLSFICNVAVLVKSTLAIKENVVSDRPVLIDDLMKFLGERIKIIHGRETGDIGIMGNSDRTTFGILLPSFFEILAALSNLQFGEARLFDVKLR